MHACPALAISHAVQLAAQPSPTATCPASAGTHPPPSPKHALPPTVVRLVNGVPDDGVEERHLEGWAHALHKVGVVQQAPSLLQSDLEPRGDLLRVLPITQGGLREEQRFLQGAGEIKASEVGDPTGMMQLWCSRG
jgi:hypothetical protein